MTAAVKTDDVRVIMAGILSLAEAREAAREARVLAKTGTDPIQQRKTLVAASLEAAASQRTFAQCAEAYIEMHRQSWKNAKHAGQWSSTLERYAFPTIGTMAVGDIETSHILRVLEPDLAHQDRNGL